MKQMLEINNLTVAFETGQGDLTAVNGVTLSLAEGETLALVGESGCGKTVLCKSIMNLLCDKGHIRQGEILVRNCDITSLSKEEVRAYRGRDVAMIFQDPMTSLDPTMTVGDQIAEVFQIHGKESKVCARSRAVALMEMMDIDQPSIRYDQMPYQFSGGMRQRIAIAIALAGNPKILLADEPTTALDQETRLNILAQLKRVQKQTNTATIFVTHDLSLVEQIADKVAIMENGSVVEIGPVTDVFASPAHAYTKKLLGYLNYTKNKGHKHGKRIIHGEPIVTIKNAGKNYLLNNKSLNTVFYDLNLAIRQGEILGLIGPSGCGKSTLARCIMDFEQLSSGSIECHCDAKVGWKQLIFQDSASALNTRMTVEKIIGEPIRIAEGRRPSPERIIQLMEQVELDPSLIDRKSVV